MRLGVGRVRGVWGFAALLALSLVVGAFAAGGAQARTVFNYTGNLSADTGETYSKFAAAAGVTVNTSQDMPYSLTGYSCVILHLQQQAFDFNQVQFLRNYLSTGGTLIAVGEYGGFNSDFPRQVMNSVASGVGATMQLNNVQLDGGLWNTTTNIGADPLTQGVTSIRYAGTASLTASGTARVLLRTRSAIPGEPSPPPFPNTPFMGVQSVNGGTFVLTGDSNVLENTSDTGYTAQKNGTLASNLCGDRTPPVVTISVPIQNKKYKLGATVPAQYGCIDPEGTNDIASVVGNVPNGDPIDTSGTVGQTIAKTFTVVCTDQSNLQDTKSVTYYVDGRPPDITLTTPTDGATYSQGASVIADYSCTDDDAVAELTGTQVNGYPINTGTTGQHTFTVTCKDVAGNVSTVTHTYTVVDNTPPTITIARPANSGHYKLNASVTAAYSCVDEDGPGDIPPGQPVAAVAVGSNFNTASTGTKTFTVTCTDTSNNTATKTVSYYVDGQPPVITVNAPLDNGAYKLNAGVPAAYSCTDDDAVATLVGTVPVGTNFNTATAGPKSFTVTCTDLAGNTATKVVSYLVDDQPPTVVIVAPADQGRYRLNQSVPANYTCSDNDTLKAGQPVGPVPVGSTFSTSPIGAKTFTVTCEDRAGNVATKTVDYVVDDSPPVIDITVPSQGARYQIGSSVPTSFTCTDDDGPFDIAFCKGPGGISSGGPLDTSGVSGQTVEKDFLVTTQDLAGNAASKGLTYFVDGSPPVITITTPANGGRYALNQSLAASYDCTDDHGLAPGSPTGTVAVGQPVDTGTSGEKSFTVTCVDDVGNVATKTVTYKVAGNNPPAVDIQSPKDNATFGLNATIALSFSCSDPDGQDDLAKCARVGASGPLDSGKAGTFTFTIEAVDLEGHRATKTQTYTVTSKPAAAAAPTTTSSTTKKACSSRRQFTIRVKKTKKKQKLRIIRVAVSVNGKQTQVKKGKRLTAVVTLKGLPKGRYRVVIKAKLSNGRTITDVRRFRTCTPKGRTS